MHHLFAEVIDNSMDEAVAGHANFIDIDLDENGYLSVTDNGRGMPVDAHPKFKDKSALEVIMTMLHAGGKFDSKVYETSGGLHGVGVSVVNALSDHCEVEVARNRKLYRQRFSRGKALGPHRRGRRSAKPPRHACDIPSRRRDFWTGREIRSRPPLQDGAIEGLSFRRRRNSLELRAVIARSEGPDAG